MGKINACRIITIELKYTQYTAKIKINEKSSYFYQYMKFSARKPLFILNLMTF